MKGQYITFGIREFPYVRGPYIPEMEACPFGLFNTSSFRGRFLCLCLDLSDLCWSCYQSWGQRSLWRRRDRSRVVCIVQSSLEFLFQICKKSSLFFLLLLLLNTERFDHHTPRGFCWLCRRDFPLGTTTHGNLPLGGSLDQRGWRGLGFGRPLFWGRAH